VQRVRRSRDAALLLTSPLASRIRVMPLRRKGEPPGGRHFRSSDRFLMANGAWYFTTREHIDVGPFTTRGDAVKACERLIDQLRTVSVPDDARKTIDDFIRFQLRRG
jgi:Domain of unknown function (DUF6316)